MTDEKKVKEKKTIVVPQLPTSTLREIKDEAGNEYECLTIEEALTQILEKVKKIEIQIS